MKNKLSKILLLAHITALLFGAETAFAMRDSYSCQGEGWNLSVARYYAPDDARADLAIIDPDGEMISVESNEITEDNGIISIVAIKSNSNNSFTEFKLQTKSQATRDEKFAAQLSFKIISLAIGGTIENDPNMNPPTIIEMQCHN